MENTIETPISTIPHTHRTPISPLDSSPRQLAYLIQLLSFDDNESTKAAAPRTLLHDAGSQHYVPANAAPSYIQSDSYQDSINPDQRYQTGLHTPLLLPSQLYPSTMIGNYSRSAFEESSPDWDWLRDNIPSFSGVPSIFDRAPQDGASNSATWLHGGADNLMQEGLSFNNGLASESLRMDHFAATGRNGTYSVSGWSRSSSSGISGDLWNQESYQKDGLDWLEVVDVLEEALNEYGSKKLQEIVAQHDERKTNMIVKKTLAGMLLIMTNKYGQYLFMKLIKSCNASQLHMIVAEVTTKVETLVAISCHQYGSQCVKKLIKVLEKSPMAARITLALSCGFFELMIHKTGSYAISMCFEVLNCQQNEVLYSKLLEQCLELATHETGCLSLNRSISHIKGKFRDDLLRKISVEAAYLAHDPSGNFVIQHVVGLANPIFTTMICQQLKGHYVALSTKIGGSHVVEKCLKSEDGHHAVNDLLKCNKLGHIARDRYGNYVLQTALRETKKAGSPLHKLLLTKILPFNELHQGYGNKVLSFINKGVPLDD